MFERSGDVVTIEDKLPKPTSRGAGTQLTVRVPRDSRMRGRIEAHIAASRLAARLVSGRVQVDNTQPLGRGHMTTVSGHLSLTTPLEPDVELEMETVSGNGTLTFSGPLNVRVNVLGGPGGNIRNRLDDTPVQRRAAGIGKRLETSLGEGRGYVRASTSGNRDLEIAPTGRLVLAERSGADVGRRRRSGR